MKKRFNVDIDQQYVLYLKTYVNKCFRINNDGRIFDKDTILKVVAVDVRKDNGLEYRFACNAINKKDCPHLYYLNCEEFIGWIGTAVTLVDEKGEEVVKEDVVDNSNELDLDMEKALMKLYKKFDNNDIPCFPAVRMSFNYWVDYVNRMF